MTRSKADRFWAKVNKDGPVPEHVPGLGPCWAWIGSLNRSGYGRFFRGPGRPKIVLAHRFVYAMTVGDIPAGMCVCHRCDNPACVNPDHLFVGTPGDNNRDMVEKGRNRGAPGDRNRSRRRPETRPRGEAHGRAKVTTGNVREIRARRAAGESLATLAAEFGLSKASVYQIVHRMCWKHVA